MRIATFNPKGGQGKTSLALALALEIPASIVSNDINARFEFILPESAYRKIAPDEQIPLYPNQYNIVYDLRGAFDESAMVLLDECDLVVLPVRLGDAEDEEQARELANTLLSVLPNLSLAIVLINDDKTVTGAQAASITEIFTAAVPAARVFQIPYSKVLRNIKRTGTGISEQIELYLEEKNKGAAGQLKRRIGQVLDNIISLAKE